MPMAFGIDKEKRINHQQNHSDISYLFVMVWRNQKLKIMGEQMQDETQQAEPELEALLNQAIAEGFVEVPILPEVANKAFMLANDNTSDASQMAKLIESDPSLAGHVMRIANSVAYTPMATLVSLQQAIARLGMMTISEIAIAAVLGAKLFNTPGYEAYVEANWRQSLATSLWAKEIGRYCNVNVEVAFLAGLIHSMGRPAILQTLIDLAAQHDLPLDAAILHELEDKYWLSVSQMVVIRWQMPTLVIETIQHLATSSAETVPARIAAIVDAANLFAKAMLADELSLVFDFAQCKSIAMLNLDTQTLANLVEMQAPLRERLKGLTV